MKTGFLWPLVLMLMLLSGCASTVPPQIREAPPADLSLAQASADIEGSMGQAVRWGGNIVSVTNEERETRVEIVARQLYGSGRPGQGDASPGRFIAVFDVFLDPLIYTRDREITVSGTVQGETMGTIGSHRYTYPLVRVSAHQLWQPRADPDYYPYDPFYSPWYGPYPWRYPYHYRYW